MASVKQPSLPSFAQTFQSIGGNGQKGGGGPAHTLPPLQGSSGSRKRVRGEGEDNEASSLSPPIHHNEEHDDEQEVDMLEPSPPAAALPGPDSHKRRRIAGQTASSVSPQMQPQRRGSITAAGSAVAAAAARRATHTLPPPPISFAKRRSAKKPADIVISPRRDTDHFAPAIQSAPPIPSHHRMPGMPAPIGLPRIPPIGASTAGSSRGSTHAPGRVPPTPTRFTVYASASQHPPPPPPPSSGAANVRSPPHASVPISSIRPPTTPASFSHTTYTNEKSAFLAPFETFYDALNDSKQLKSWLSDQLNKSQALTQSLQHQHDNLTEIVENLVERKVGTMRREMVVLSRRVEELEALLRQQQMSDPRNRSQSFSSASASRYVPVGGPVDSYSFPPIAERPPRPPPSPPYRRMDSESPTPYETRRLSISAARLEGPGTSRDRDRDRDREPPLPPPSLSRNRHSGDVPTLSSTKTEEEEMG